MTARFITAIGTPLDENENLHHAGLVAHLADQAKAGTHGILVAGTMGMMQLLTDSTYRQLVEASVSLFTGKGEVLIGAGDLSQARSLDRIAYLNGFKIDGVAVLAPPFVTFGKAELIEYYRSLADASKAPIYLYDLPQLTKTKLDFDTVLQLAKHPNIRGIKCSDEPGYTRQLADQLVEQLPDKGFRVIIAAPDLVDMTLRHGFVDQLDGMWTMAPYWCAAIGQAAAAGDWAKAAAYQRDLSAVKRQLVKFGVLPTFSALMNARGIPGSFAPRPFRPLSAADQTTLLAEPVIQRLLQQPRP